MIVDKYAAVEDNEKMVGEELKPCPFCGGDARETKDCDAPNIGYAECIECGTCWGHCGSQFQGRFKKWNRRFEILNVPQQPKIKD